MKPDFRDRLRRRGHAARRHVAIACSFAALTAAAEEWRAAAPDELQKLFETAVQKPAQSHFSAEIVETTRPRTPEEVVQLLDRQKKAHPELEWNAEAEARWKEAAAGAIAGVRRREVEQWYSKTYYRTDEFDDVLDRPQAAKRAGRRYVRTMVDLYDPSFSPYTRFRINYNLRSITLDRSPGRKNNADYLWSAYCMEPDLLSPVLGALSGLAPDQLLSLARARYHGMERLRAEAAQLERLSRHADPLWRAERAIEAGTNGARLRLRLAGKLRIGTASYDVLADYELERHGARAVLVSGGIENRTLGTTFHTERLGFSAEQVATQWRNSRTHANGETIVTTINLWQIDAAPFADKDVFPPPTPETHPLFTHADVSTGRPAILFRPAHGGRSPRSLDGKRAIILGLLGIFSLFAVRKAWKSRAMRA